MTAHLATTLAAALASGAAVAGGLDSQKLLGMVDVSHPCYGKSPFGEPKVNVFRARDGSLVLAYQPRRLLDQNIDFVAFVVEGGVLKGVKGKYVESLCDVCDGWDAAEPEDVFQIPIAIDAETLVVRPELDEAAKKDLLVRPERRVKANLSVQGVNRRYPAFVASVRGRIEELLGRR